MLSELKYGLLRASLKPSAIPYGDLIDDAIVQEFYKLVWQAVDDDKLSEDKLFD